MHIDEKIALIEKEKRAQAKREQEGGENNNDPMDGTTYTVEGLREKIKKGKALVGFKTISFETRTITNGALKVPFQVDFYDVIDEGESVVWYASNKHSVTLTLCMIGEAKKRGPVTEWKDFMVEQMMGNKIYMDVKKTETMGHLDYICYETPTAKGVLYNITFQLIEEERYFVGTYNCPKEEQKRMGTLLEAMVQEIDEYRD